MIRICKPITPGRRGMSTVSFAKLAKKASNKKLLKPKKRISGRNNQGRITVRHRGGGHKRFYRIVDFNQTDKIGVHGTIKAIEYDPNRTAFIALVFYNDGEKRYILAPEGIKIGDQIVAKEKTKVKIGNRMLLKNIPQGYNIYNVELLPGKGGALVRSAGASARIVSHEEKYVQLELPSGEIRMVPNVSYASVGIVSNIEHSNVVIGKAGRVRYMGRRPHVRGKAMTPRDHPHGGGEGNSPIGLKHPKTPWGKPALGVKTRKSRKYSDKWIIKKRKGRK